MEEEGKTLKEKCFVCDSEDLLPLYSLIDPLPHSEDFSRTANGLTGNTALVLNQQLSVIFLLRKVLRIDRGFLEGTLQSTGSNPSLWNLKLCRVCYRTFEEADFVFTRLKKLHVEFRELSNVLWIKLIHSVKNQKSLPTEKPLPSSSSRKRKRRGRPKRAKVLEKVEVEDPSLTVGDKIRRAIFTQANNDLSIAQDLEELILQYKSHLNVPPASPCVKSSCLKSSTKRTLKVQFTEIINEDVGSKTSETHCEEIQDGELPEYRKESEKDASEPEPEHIEIEDNNSDLDYVPDLNSNDECDDDEKDDNDLVEDDDDADSDFEIKAPRSRRRDSRRKLKGSIGKSNSSNMGIILKAVKMENTPHYTCPKCEDVFENAALCDEHILHKHYDGKWPRNFACHLCEDVAFKGEYWLRHHYKMRHPGIKWAVDETIERSIGEGLMPELTYEVIPVGQTMTVPDTMHNDLLEQDSMSEHSALFHRTVDEPPQNVFSIPVVQAAGQIRHLVLPNSMKRLPPEAFALIEVGSAYKACSRCDKTFPTELQLRAHIRRVHEGETMAYDCPMCPKTFERIGKTLLHVQRTHILSLHTCEKCGNNFKEEILLKAHIQRNHFGIEYPYKCFKCSSRYPRRSTLNKHLKSAHKLQIASYHLFVKPKKKPSLAVSSLLKKRKRSKNKKKLEKKFACETCAKSGLVNVKFVSEEDLDVHIKRRHMGIPRPYPCPICEKKYSTPAKVENHMNTHTVRSDLHIDDEAAEKAKVDGLLPFVCTPCNKQFRNKALYKVHMNGRNHLDLKPFVCELCSQGFSGMKYLQNHQSQKHFKELNIDPFKCKFCNKVLSSKRSLNDHIKLHHTRDANYSCPHCDVQFQHISSMEQHINALHTKSTQFLCPQCPKTFLRDFYLKNHMMRVHSGEKPYECQYCHKKFSDKPTYNRHVEAHSNVVHSCPHCGKSGFKTRHALRVHRRTFHKAILDELERKKKIEAFVDPKQLSPNSQTNDDPLSGDVFDSKSTDSKDFELSKLESPNDIIVKADCPSESSLNLFR